MPDYGNVPPDDVGAVQSAVKVAAKVAARLPYEAPGSWREAVYELVLDGILRDWVINGTTDLDDGDEEDLISLLKLAADTALLTDEAVRDIAFKTVLRQVMSDWVENWNAED